MIGVSGMANPKKRILITGTTGFLGYNLYEYLKSFTNWEIIGTSKSEGKNVDYITDLVDLNSVKDLERYAPIDVIIHTAAISKTDICEKNKDICYAANVISTSNLISTYKEAKIVYISTYAVYNTPDGNCTETSPTSATNYYIETKIMSETMVMTSPQAIIFRPSVIFGYTPFERTSKNYFMQLLENIRDKKVTQSPLNQYFNPIYVDIVSNLVKNAVEQNINGIFNLGSNEQISKYEFNKKIISRFKFDEKYLEGIDSASLSVSRPNNGTISSHHIQDTIGYRIPELDQMIEKLYQSTCFYPLISGQ